VNGELAALLRDAGVTATPDWRDVIVVQNYAPIPMAHDPRGGAWAGKNGFNLVVLSAGTPAWYCKCRTAGDAVLERETAIRSRLAGTRPGGLSVPPARLASSHRITVQAGPFVRATNFGRAIPELSTTAFADLLCATANGAAALATIALDNAADLLNPPPHVDLPSAAAEVLGTIFFSASPLAALAAAEPLAAALAAAGELPPRPQHGDLWWRNLLVENGAIWALDFERYGTLWVPLFDDLHLVWTSLPLRGPTTNSCTLERIRSSDNDARACRALIHERATAEHLTSAQLDGVLVFYLLKMAADLRTVAGDDRFAAPWLADLTHAATLLAAGERGLLSA
jgi:hypothetical protein